MLTPRSEPDDLTHVAHCASLRHRIAAVLPASQICVEEAGEDGGDGGGGNFIVIVPGANYLLSPEHVAEATDRLKSAKVILVSKTRTALGQKID